MNRYTGGLRERERVVPQVFNRLNHLYGAFLPGFLGKSNGKYPA